MFGFLTLKITDKLFKPFKNSKMLIKFEDIFNYWTLIW